ncbi:MAG: hypothetical protein PUE86_03195 [Prevotella sp.]|nr:hypothetical protein [Prevotella sp.]MDD6591011.1 hypothetical protein [Prevotella sp.]
MKKLLLALVALFTLTTSASAMSYEQARERALFLTDKMAYELNLTDDQYEAAYEVNLDYLMGINDYNDLYGAYWRQRNLDFSYILLDWQYRAFCAASYFHRPLYWDAGCWHFAIYARYPHRHYFYFGRPHFYTVYRGGHSWRMNGGKSWYYGRTYGAPARGTRNHSGMRDGFERGDYGRGYQSNQPSRDNNYRQHGTQNGNRQTGNGNRSFGNSNRQSSTRTTTTAPNNGSSSGHRSFGGSRSNTSSPSTTAPKKTFTPSTSTSGSRSFGIGSSSSSSSRQVGSSSSSSTRSFGGGSSSSSTRSFGGGSSSSSTRSFGGGSSSSSTRSFGGGSSSSSTRSSGGSSSNGSRFGGRR